MEKITISIENNNLKRIDFYVKEKIFKNRSQAFQLSITQILERLDHKRLARECEKLNIQEEQQEAELGFDEDAKSWPEY